MKFYVCKSRMNLSSVFEKISKKMVRCVGKSLCGFLLTLCANYALADVYISEFIADNKSSLLTADGEGSDWIELHNDGTTEADISGWYLTDDSSNLTAWMIPSGTVIAPDGYLIIFADKTPLPIIKNELHTNFRLSAEGEYLALVKSDGITIACDFAPAYPPQYKDVGYGLTQLQTPLINDTTPVRYRIPNAAGNAPWHSATGGVGYTESIASFTVLCYELNTAVNSIDQAEQMIANSSYWKSPTAYPLEEKHSVVNMHGTGGAGNFSNDAPFPGQSIGTDYDDFIVTAETAVYIPFPGIYSFGVGSDDGFRLNITGHGQNFESEHPAPRGFGTTVSAFNFASAGYYDLRLIFFERGGAATLELSCAAGSFSSFDAVAFKLVGDPTAAVTMAADIGAYINTNVRENMININTRLDAEWKFELPPSIQSADTVTLKMRYMDGCSISINNNSLASLNTPSTLLWNSTATTSRSLEEGVTATTISIPRAMLNSGINTLSIIALNHSVTNGNFLISPELTHATADRWCRYFPEPTPGEANTQYYNGPTPEVTITEPHGFKSAPFTTELICIENPGATIRYTTDSSTPNLTSPAYTQPLNITKTTLLRAAVVDPDSFRQRTSTTTWLFIEDILTQGSSTPAGWPESDEINGHKMEYGMRQEIITGDPDRIRDGMTNDIPSISIVTDLKHLFNAQSGIYVNPRNDGRTWERPVSVELIDNARGAEYEFQIDAGLRIRGAFSRDVTNPKHSFRLFFRSVYGAGKLNFKLFDEHGADRYDNVDLRTAQNYSWSYLNDSHNTFVREVFSRDTQRDMGTPHTRTRYYHLYLNGQYWGLYQTQERGNANFAQSYLSGKSDDYDCVKVSQPDYTLSASDGNFDAYHALHNYTVNQGFKGAYSDNYWTVRGMEPDGSINPDKPCYLDQDNLINFMLNCYYTADPDAPISLGGTFVNNLYALYNRNEPAGFVWLRHDAEHSLGVRGGYGVNCDVTMRGTNLVTQNTFNPSILHVKLCDHPEYRMRFADLAYKHLYNGGALTAESCLERFGARVAQIDNAIVGESARWGRGKTRADHWIPACASITTTYLPYRTDVIIRQLKNNGWYPSIEPPQLSTNSATVPKGFQLGIFSAADFYHTTDGSDPRETDGGINSSAAFVAMPSGQNSTVTLIEKQSLWSYSDDGAEPPPAGSISWRESAYPDTGWPSGPGVLGVAGNGLHNPVATTTKRYVNGESGTQVITTYFRRSFNLDTTSGITSLSIELLRDDGAVIYINGTEVARSNMPAGTITYATWSATIIGSDGQTSYQQIEISDLSMLNPGENTIAVEVHQCHGSSTDMYMDLALRANYDSQCSTTLTINQPITVKARAFDGTKWSALTEVSFEVTAPSQEYDNLRITELMYAPTSPADSGSPLKNDDFAWLELRNTGTTAINLDGVSFTSGIAHTFAPYDLLPGTRLVVAKNPAALHQRHPTNTMAVVAWSSGNLARKGETLQLSTPAYSNILTFTYSNTWYPETYDTDVSIVVVDTSASEAAWSTAANWRPSRKAYGTPGNPDAPLFKTIAITRDKLMIVDTEGLEGNLELWFSEDLKGWSSCSTQIWVRDGDSITIDLTNPLLVNCRKGFFQLRISD